MKKKVEISKRSTSHFAKMERAFIQSVYGLSDEEYKELDLKVELSINQMNFLLLTVIAEESIENIEIKINIPISTLIEWKIELKETLINWFFVKEIWLKVAPRYDFHNFYLWFMDANKEFKFCEISDKSNTEEYILIAKKVKSIWKKRVKR
jgi:hypothetical protein